MHPRMETQLLKARSSTSPRTLARRPGPFFGGLTNDEIGALLGIDARTMRRDWTKARSLLRAVLDS